MTEDEMDGGHHQLNGHEFEQTLGNGEGQGGLVCYRPWGHRFRPDLVTEQQEETCLDVDDNMWRKRSFCRCIWTGKRYENQLATPVLDCLEMSFI